jgi:pimeloyl-ACP methyl ester carboxylesterase
VEGFAEVNGGRLWYEMAGSGPAVVMLHGHLVDSGQWDDQFDVFSREFTVVRYDARGFGRSDQPTEPFAYYEDLRSLLTVLGIDRPLLIGCSGGGSSTINLALAYPEVPRALVLVGTGLPGYRSSGGESQTMVELGEALEQAYQRGDVDAAVELGLRLWTDGERRRPEDVDAGARARTGEMMRRLFSRPRVEVEPTDPLAVSRVGELHLPTLVVVGADDALRIREIADLVEARVAGARKVVIQDAGHHPNMEHPEEFNEVVLNFLRSVPAD